MMAVVYLAPEPYARIEKAVQRRKSYMYRCTACDGEFYFCGTNPNYNYCPRCGRPFAKEVDDAKNR